MLPGERLSRAGDPDDGELEAEIEVSLEASDAAPTDGSADLDGVDADGRRRRRRRGGRGRGRGRQQYETPRPTEGGVEVSVEDEEFLEDEIAPLPQHSTFGSVWDNQLGVTPPPISAGGEPGDEEDYEDEPEVPEYLLAERRQRGRGGRPGGMRPQGGASRRGGYQSAVDRERYGRAGAPSYGGGGGGNRIDRGRPQTGNRGPRPQQPRPQRPAYQEPMREQERPFSSSAEPWSEVPPEVQELLRAELARRQAQGGTRGNEGYRRQESPAVETQAAEPAAASAVAEPEPAAARGRRTRSTGRSTAGATSTTETAIAETVIAETAATATPPKRATERRMGPRRLPRHGAAAAHRRHGTGHRPPRRRPRPRRHRRLAAADRRHLRLLRRRSLRPAHRLRLRPRWRKPRHRGSGPLGASRPPPTAPKALRLQRALTAQPTARRQRLVAARRAALRPWQSPKAEVGPRPSRRRPRPLRLRPRQGSG